RHARWSGDWSSDVCSSDLERKAELIDLRRVDGRVRSVRRVLDQLIGYGLHIGISRAGRADSGKAQLLPGKNYDDAGIPIRHCQQIGRASCRETVLIARFER